MKLDLGCGPKKKPGFIGVDRLTMPGVDTLCDLRVVPWPWADDSVDEVHCTCDFACHYGYTIEDGLRNEAEAVKKKLPSPTTSAPRGN